MGRPLNNPYCWDELKTKRFQLFELYIKNTNFIIDSLSIENSFKFGKHEELSIKYVIENNPEYIEHLIGNFEDKCFDFNQSIFYVSKFITQQHIQLNQIKLEISKFQKLSLWYEQNIPEIPLYYQLIC